MKHHLIVVEGAHDAAFFGKLLRKRGFSEVVLFDHLIEPWHGLVPRRFPIREDGRLDKIIVYPNVYRSQDEQTWIGIAIAGGGEDKIIEALRAPIELNSISSFASVGIAIDADWRLDVTERYRRFKQVLDAWNIEEEAGGLTGFPIELPDEPNKVVGTHPKFGVFLFPESQNQGTLETLMLECAHHAMPEITIQANQFVDAVIRHDGVDTKVRKEISTGSGNQKCQCGVIASVLSPGASLAVALRGGTWLTPSSLSIPCIAVVDEFLTNLLAI